MLHPAHGARGQPTFLRGIERDLPGPLRKFSAFQKISLSSYRKMCLSPAIPPQREGRCARSSRHARRGCGGRESSRAGSREHADERSLADVKSQRPDTPMLVFRSRRRSRRRADHGGQKARRTRETAYKRETAAQGMPECSAAPVVPAACTFLRRRAMGEAFTRHSLRPLDYGRGELIADLGHHVPRDRVATSCLRCLRRESDLSQPSSRASREARSASRRRPGTHTPRQS